MTGTRTGDAAAEAPKQKAKVWSASANLWAPGVVVGRSGEKGTDKERVIVQYDIPGVGPCEKKLRVDSANLRLEAPDEEEAQPEAKADAQPEVFAPESRRASAASVVSVTPEALAAAAAAGAGAGIGATIARPPASVDYDAIARKKASCTSTTEAWRPPPEAGQRGNPDEDGTDAGVPPLPFHLSKGPTNGPLPYPFDPDFDPDKLREALSGNPTKESDPEAMKLLKDPRERLSDRLGVYDESDLSSETFTDIQDAFSDMPTEVCDLFLYEAIDPTLPRNLKALAWTLAQCNEVMAGKRGMPFGEIFPALVRRMADIGGIHELAFLLSQNAVEEVEQYVAAEIHNSEIVCIGIAASEGAKLWSRLRSSERRLVTKLVLEGLEIPSAESLYQLLLTMRSGFVALQLTLETLPPPRKQRLERQRLDASGGSGSRSSRGSIDSNGMWGKEAAFEILRCLEPEMLRLLYQKDHEVGREAMLRLVEFFFRARGTDRLQEVAEHLTPLIDKFCTEQFVFDDLVSIRVVIDFSLAYVSLAREVKDAEWCIKAQQGMFNVPFLLFKRAFDRSSHDAEGNRFLAIEAGFLLLDPSTDAPIRRFVQDERFVAPGPQLGEWCSIHLSTLFHTALERSLGDDALDEAALAVAKDGQGHVLWRSDPHEQFFDAEQGVDRRPMDLVQLIFAFFRVASWMKRGWELMGTLTAELDFCGAAGYSTTTPGALGPYEAVVPRWSTLRESLVPDLSRVFYNSIPVSTIAAIFGCRTIFRASFHAMVVGLVERREEDMYHGVMWELVEVAAKLDSIRLQDQLEEGVMEIRDLLQNHITRKPLTKLLRRVASIADASRFVDVGKRPGETVVFTFEKLRACALRLHSTCESLAGEPSSKMMSNLDSILDEVLKARPVAWLPLIINIDTILLAMKYQEQEDLEEAFRKFRSSNKFNEGDDFSGLLFSVQEVLRRPLVESKGLDLLADNLDLGELIMKREAESPFTDRVAWGGAVFGAEDWRIVLQIVIAQLENMRSKMKVYMQPHHTQMITLLLFAFNVCAAKQGVHEAFKTVIAEVGTGEGKSWIIAMLAAFVAKKGLRAHILVDNAALRHRDLALMGDFFAGVGLTAVDASENSDALRDNSRVVYCSGSHLDQMFWDSIKKGVSPPLHDAVLILDECDGIVIDGSAYYVWQHADDSLAAEHEAWLAAYKKDGHLNAIKETGMDKRTLQALGHFRSACKSLPTKKRGVDYEVINGKYWALDKITMLPSHLSHTWLDILRVLETGGSLKAQESMGVSSTIYSLKLYKRIFGLTGSLGGPSESKFLQTQYGAVSFKVPSYLDTCPGAAGKKSPVLLESDQILQQSEDAQIDKVVQLVIPKCRDVPVLILAENPRKRELFMEALLQCDQLPNEYLDMANHGLQTLAGSQGRSKTSDYVRKVELATKPLHISPESAASMRGVGSSGDWPRKSWPISLSCPDGGRGQDYRVTDTNVDKHGGLLVIVTFVPQSIRDFMQFKGRTARQDRQGQYAVILDSSSAEGVKALLDRGLHGEEAIEALLETMDKSRAKTLQSVERNTQKTALMQELSVEFWRQKAGGGLASQQVHEWIVLCNDFSSKSVEEIREHWNAAFGEENTRRRLSATAATKPEPPHIAGES